MCLSTVYLNEKRPEAILMKECASISCVNNEIILTDLFEKELRIHGQVKYADLTGGTVLIEDGWRENE